MEKELVPGKTQIGQIDGKYEGLYRKFTIYYGNVASPVINNNVLHLSENKYMEMLKTFLSSKEGSEYRIPSETEIKSTIKNMINEETRIKNAREEEFIRKDEERQAQEARKNEEQDRKNMELKREEIEVQKQANKLKQKELDSLLKKNKTLKLGLVGLTVVLIIMAVAIALLYIKVGILKI